MKYEVLHLKRQYIIVIVIIIIERPKLNDSLQRVHDQTIFHQSKFDSYRTQAVCSWIFFWYIFVSTFNIFKILFPGISLGGLLGGILYEKCGGAWTFQLFSYGSSTVCVLHVVFHKFFKSNEHTTSLDTNLHEDVSLDGKNKSG